MKKLNDVAHKLSLSLSLSLSSFSQISNATVQSSHHPSCCSTHNPNPRQKCESRQKKEGKKKKPLKTHKTQPHSNRPSLTHSLTASFTKMQFLCKFLVVSAIFFFKDTHSGRRKSTQENTIFFRRENIKKAGERKSFNKNRKKNSRQRKIQILPPKQNKIKNSEEGAKGKGRASSHAIKCRRILQNNESL